MHFIYIHSNRAHSRLFHLVSHPDSGCYGCFDGFFAIRRFCRNWCFWHTLFLWGEFHIWLPAIPTFYTYTHTNQTAEDAYVIQDVSSAQLLKTLHRQIITKSEYGQSSSMQLQPITTITVCMTTRHHTALQQVRT